MSKDVAAALRQVLVSPNECDSNLEAANMVDGLFAIARALHRIAEAIEPSAGDHDQDKQHPGLCLTRLP